jgi:hypothetical protein
MSPSPDTCARIDRPSFRENKPKTLVFSHTKRALIISGTELNPPPPNKEYDPDEGIRQNGLLDENRDFHNISTFKPDSGDFDPVIFRKPPVTT